MTASWSGRNRLWLLPAMLLLVFAAWSLVGVVADLAAFRGKAWVETWSFQAIQAQARGEAYSPLESDWQEARNFGEWSVRLSPLNADYREGLAGIYETHYIMAPPGAPQARPDRERAVGLYRDSIALRPDWPYAHAALAYALLRLGNHDQEMERALTDAARLGPWEPQVMEAVVDVGLDTWYRISPAMREVVSDTVLRSQSWKAGTAGQAHADRVWGRVEIHHKQALACARLPMQDERIRTRCNPANWK